MLVVVVMIKRRKNQAVQGASRAYDILIFVVASLNSHDFMDYVAPCLKYTCVAILILWFNRYPHIYGYIADIIKQNC